MILVKLERQDPYAKNVQDYKIIIVILVESVKNVVKNKDLYL